MYTTEQIRYLINTGREEEFYKSYGWQKTAALARELQHNECQRCKKNGWFSPCEIVHHKERLKEKPELAYNQDNLECLCLICHNEEHLRVKEVGFANTERW